MLSPQRCGFIFLYAIANVQIFPKESGEKKDDSGYLFNVKKYNTTGKRI